MLDLTRLVVGSDNPACFFFGSILKDCCFTIAFRLSRQAMRLQRALFGSWTVEKQQSLRKQPYFSIPSFSSCFPFFISLISYEKGKNEQNNH
jgi:hypothetical protein